MANAGDAREYEHETAPDRTTFQGTQQEGVEHGHEDTDANLRSIVQWLGMTGLFMALSIVVMWWVFDLWSGYEERKEALSPLVFAKPLPPPEPRVLPNPSWDPRQHPDEPIRGPAELLRDVRRQEDQDLQRAGLEDPRGQPALPPAAVAAVVNHQAAARGGYPPKVGAAAGPSVGAGLVPARLGAGTSPAPTRPMPSYSSGGTALENELAGE